MLSSFHRSKVKLAAMKFSSTKVEGYGIICTNVYNSDLNGPIKASSFSQGFVSMLWGRFPYECVLPREGHVRGVRPRVFQNLRRMHEYWNLLPLRKTTLRDYRIGSNFWKFYLIRTGFFDESV
jgi:hypothetical protein